MNHLKTRLERLFGQPELQIMVTDSGLGGLAVMAELVETLRPLRVFPALRITYFNALFDNASGYNRLASSAEKVRIFNAVLENIQQKYQPDLLLIACNTLSVIYHDTRFSQQAAIPVIDILEAGVQPALARLRDNPAAKLIIFATPTTISTGYHRRELEHHGIHPARIVEQPCLELVDAIERGWDSAETRARVDEYVTAALKQMPDDDSPFYVSLNCTHYGYAMPWWQQAFQNRHKIPAAILNPNHAMLDFLQNPRIQNKKAATELQINVVAKVEITPDMMQSIGGLIKGVSPATYQAMRDYRLIADLFPH